MNRTVLTKYGRVTGIPAGIPKFTVFRGIPYAKPPVGARRWRAPAAPEPWADRLCDTFPPASIQPAQEKGAFYEVEFFQAGYEVSEDCLHLNIWADLEKKGQPVMLWIHGGAYNHGFGHEMEFDGEQFCKRGVILVTINYRLGALGFMAHPALTARDGHSGNYGLMDQMAALEWVRGNIAAFGGDPDNITLFGQSAGGGSVQALMAAPRAAGLFRRSIIMSAGSPLASLGGGMTQAQAEETGLALQELSGADFPALCEMDALEILKYARMLKGGIRFRPCVDGFVLPEEPGRAFARGAAWDESLMLGSVAGDAGLFGNPVAATVALAKARIAQKKPPCYVYHFKRDVPGDDRPGAFHSSELWYVFGTLQRAHRPFVGLDYDLSLQMADWWANFARTGDPGGGFSAYTAESPAFLEIGEHTEMVNIKSRPLADELSDNIIRSANA